MKSGFCYHKLLSSKLQLYMVSRMKHFSVGRKTFSCFLWKGEIQKASTTFFWRESEFSITLMHSINSMMERKVNSIYQRKKGRMNLIFHFLDHSLSLTFLAIYLNGRKCLWCITTQKHHNNDVQIMKVFLRKHRLIMKVTLDAYFG